MKRPISQLDRAALNKRGGRLFSFLCIGGFGAIVNVLCFSSSYYPLLKVANSFLAYGVAFLVGTEVSIISNFILNDRFTFGGLHARAFPARCLRYHVTSISGVLLTLGISFSLLHLLHVSALPAQAAALIIATGWNFVFHQIFTYGHGAGHPSATTAQTSPTVVDG